MAETTVDAKDDYPWSLEATLQYSKFHISLTGQLLVVKRCLWVSLEATLQYSKFHLSLTGQLLMVKVSMPMFSYTYL